MTGFNVWPLQLASVVSFGFTIFGVLVHQVSDWCSGAAANFGWMREEKGENIRCGL
jgi:hypothetical protein